MLSVSRRNADELHAEKLKSMLLNFDPPFHGQLGASKQITKRLFLLLLLILFLLQWALHEESKWDFMDFSFLFFLDIDIRTF